MVKDKTFHLLPPAYSIEYHHKQIYEEIIITYCLHNMHHLACLFTSSDARLLSRYGSEKQQAVEHITC